MSLTLPAPVVHSFLPGDFDPNDLESFKSQFERLLQLPVGTQEELQAFLDAWEEFAAFAGEAYTETFLQTSCYTNDEDAKNKLLSFQQNQYTYWMQKDEEMGQKLLTSPSLEAFKGSNYAPFVEQTRRQSALFRPENVAIKSELQGLNVRYGEISGGWSIAFQGEEHTLSGMTVFLADADRSVREAAWRAVADRIHQDEGALGDLWEEMFGLRHKMAQNAGFENFRDYIFEEKQRDYTPEACVAYQDIIADEIVPLQQEINDWTREKLGLSSFCPWDTSADPDGGKPLAPFTSIEELMDGTERMMKRLDPELGEIFRQIRPHMDLESRQNKRQGGFQTTLQASRRPFIFANATGRQHDIVTLLHEAGHAFHYLASVPQTPMSDTRLPIEFCEVASMAMELLQYPHYDEFYSKEDCARALGDHLRRIPRLLCLVAQGDAFQQWLYTNPEHTRADRREHWIQTHKRFHMLDTSGISDAHLGTSWHRTLHFFKVFFYFIEYGFAQLGALQIALAAEKSPEKALAAYKHGLSLGASRNVESLYDAAGAHFVPTRRRTREIANWIRKELGL